MTDAELQALWDKNMEAPPPKRLSRSEFFEKFKKARPERNYAQKTVDVLDRNFPGVGGVADWALGFGSKTADFLANAPEAI